MEAFCTSAFNLGTIYDNITLYMIDITIKTNIFVDLPTMTFNLCYIAPWGMLQPAVHVGLVCEQCTILLGWWMESAT
jgi:hypothetical protein